MTLPQSPDPGQGSYPPPYPYPGAPGYPPRRTTSGWAIAAFALGLLACVPLGAVFGIVALVKTRGGRQSGRGLAIAGLVISAVWLLVGGIALFRMTNGLLVTGTVDSSPLVRVGECFNPDINSRVDCGQPHSDEVFAILSLSHFPNADDSQTLKDRCRAELRKYSPSASRDPGVQVVTWGPGTDWKYMNNHTTACAAHFTPDRVGSIRK
ncbi:hypothetical protein A5696_04985 [Mycobacterium sp. E2699]|uniref:DUF4190 domain-containing protein n=1 Tax=Mycobacterium sp. E2699 TaxID=1834137 RepID=UPI00080106D9|nr:DUF4190 domain-containing protein [Mycobacterium sp. E2699]OBH04372.1 hypothetical protein A5696_04985 [Mycobacterium sp. E2699]